ncbi:divergent polysaccharide deacetylase family protein [Parasedimentitalea marina]|uniref:Divergent polysaccharide deacetylase family protein n=1 Tax=Parasedimentitalea marina TaxID=2483033 RepID=A0A3T0N2E1_9RHOB|nr:divergent polysaccharide deacetylase family protein [Parasedimentitalea marina]AZV78152.1 divergent polysaccharide deacetylase family protein [Parasedimentitalea marina]
MRGFLGGVSIGAVVAVGGAAMLSLSAPLPKVVDVTAQTPSETSEPTDETGLPIETPGPDADLVEMAPIAPSGESGAELSGLQGLDTEPGSRPVVGADETALSDPDEPSVGGGLSPEVATQTDSPVVPVDALPVPSVPSPEAEIVVSSDPAQPGQPGGEPQLPELDPDTTAPEIIASIAETLDGPAAGDRGADIVTNPGTEDAPVAPENPESAPVTVPAVSVDVPTMLAPDTGTMPVSQLPTVVDSPAEQFVPGESRDAGGNSAEAQEDSLDQPGEQIAALPTTTNARDASGGPTIGTPVVPLTERNSEGSGNPSSESQVVSPFESFAEPFTNPEGRPLMAIVLIDDTQSIGAEALVGFPYPLSFAIDPQDPKATEKMAARRAAGFEVLVLTDLPREAAPQDAETSLAVWFDTLPESIGVLEGTGTGFQGNRPLADQVSAVVAASGRGLLTQNHGLNTVQKLALRDGVPASVVFRDFDGAGQNPKAIRRFLDQAAFRAGQEGAVIMLGRVRPDTISALLLWGLQDRASRVALSPASAVLSYQITNN